MSTWDEEIYASEEYKERMKRARQSLIAMSYHETLDTAAESIAYWQMRAVKAEKCLFKEGLFEGTPTNVSTRFE